MPDWQDRVLLLLRREFTRASEPQYYRLDGRLSLESNLKRKAVIEFPGIIVALREDEAQYPTAYDRIEIVSTGRDDSGDKSGEDPTESEAEEGGEDDADTQQEENSVEPSLTGKRGASEADAVDNPTVAWNVVYDGFVGDEQSLDDLLPSIAEADDELLMFGGDVDGVEFLKQPSSECIVEELVGLSGRQ